jgi:membrane protein DedA with SNARE-associated domain
VPDPGGAAGVGGLAALALLLPMEAGVPIPLPADLVMFTVGQQVAAGRFPLWLAVAGFEAIAVLGTTALFLVSRGPAHRLIARFGPRLGLTPGRLGRATALAEARGRPGLAAGRALPGLRTLTVIAAGASGLAGRRALPALILGSSVFLQVHLVLGLLLGPLAAQAFDQAKLPALVAAAALAVAVLIFWRTRRRQRAAPNALPADLTAPPAWREATCPVCLAVTLLADRLPALADLTAPDLARPGPDGESASPKASLPFAAPTTSAPTRDGTNVPSLPLAQGLGLTPPAGRGPGSAGPGARRRAPR